MDQRFGILTFPSGSFAAIAAEWRKAEARGFDGAFLVDTLAKPGLVDYEAWVTLAALARETARMRIGTLVTVLALRHPALLAAQALSVDHISEGRLDLGIGTGEDPGDLAAVGIDHWPTDERLERLAEQLAVLDRSLRGGRSAHAGRFYRSDELHLAMPVPNVERWPDLARWRGTRPHRSADRPTSSSHQRNARRARCSWPPLASRRRREPVPHEARTAFERIATERLPQAGRSA